MDSKAKSLEFKAEGNAALSSQDYAEAIECYTKAIELDSTNHVFFSNRSAAKLSSGDAEGALADAEGCIAAKPDWKKGYGRKGAALHQLQRWSDATAAYDAGLELAPGDAALLSGKKDVSSAEERSAMSAMGGMGMGGLGGLFSGMNGNQASGLLGMLGDDANIRSKCLASGDPETRAIASDGSFFALVAQARANPAMGQMLQQDPRFLKVFSAVLSGPGGFGSDAAPASAAAAAAAPSASPAAAAPAPEPAAEPEPEEELTPEEQAERDAEKAAAAELAATVATAMEHKAAGNVAFKAKDYAAAISGYNKAIEVYADEPTFYMNRGKVRAARCACLALALRLRLRWDCVCAHATRALGAARSQRDAAPSGPKTSPPPCSHETTLTV